MHVPYCPLRILDCCFCARDSAWRAAKWVLEPEHARQSFLLLLGRLERHARKTARENSAAEVPCLTS